MIKVEIGKQYASVRDRLREEIRCGTLEGLELLAQNHVCYCCVRRIEGKMYAVGFFDGEGVTGLFLHKVCYEDAQAVEYREGGMVQ